MLAEIDETQITEGLNVDIRISAPKIQQSNLSFCADDLSAFEAWSKKLPMANVGASAKLLYQASRELNITHVTPLTRYKMLEIIRGPIYSICELLGKRFLNQSVVLNQNDLKVVMLAQTLQNQLATGYKRIILDIISAPEPKEGTPKLLTFAIHRAITDLSHTVLRSLQLYSPTPKGAWLELHQLYALASKKRIQSYGVKDSQAVYRASTTILESYLRILLLGCSKPNQLRQSEQADLYAATELWCHLTKLAPRSDEKSPFIFMTTNDSAPVYRTLVKNIPVGAVRMFNPLALVDALQQHANQQAADITIPGKISEALLNHLFHAWGGMKQRSFRRTQSSGDIHIGIGLVSTHFFCANEKSFPYLLTKWNVELSKSKPKKSSTDVWENSFDADNNLSVNADDIAFDSIAFLNKNTIENADTGPHGKKVMAMIENTSPGGYCLNLSEPVSHVQTGELVVIKEPHMNSWSIGSIRWICTRPDKPAQLGVELLAPKAQAVAVRILNKTGDNGEYIRGIHLPALPAAGQDETLIVPIMPFKVGSKAELVNDSVQERIQLVTRKSTSKSFVQYHYQSLNKISNELTPKTQVQQHTNTDANKDTSKHDEFDSIWNKL